MEALVFFALTPVAAVVVRTTWSPNESRLDFEAITVSRSRTHFRMLLAMKLILWNKLIDRYSLVRTH